MRLYSAFIRERKGEGERGLERGRSRRVVRRRLKLVAKGERKHIIATFFAICREFQSDGS